MTTTTYPTIRKTILDHYAGTTTIGGGTIERVRITEDGEVHAYGQMPNSTHNRGWWLYAINVHDARRRMLYE